MESIDERDFFIKGYKIDRAKLLANFGSTEKDPENVRFLELWKHFPEPFLYIAPGEEPEGNLSLVVVLADGDDKDALEQGSGSNTDDVEKRKCEARQSNSFEHPGFHSAPSNVHHLLCTNYAFCDPLVNFQVAQPPPFLLDTESLQCTIPILWSVSLISPLGAHLDPPLESMQLALGTLPSSTNRLRYPQHVSGVTLTLTVTTNGTQYPRLAFFTFQNVEIWRSSTPIPSNVGGNGIVWTYVEDVTRFIPFFSEPGTFILQLDNAIQSGLDGEYAGDEASVPPGFSVQVDCLGI
ncbi:hypothetical protein EDB83DRAFT_2323029 [Lactarius deliciosus]|nr:hypothetical protein EDB83DRAFT_2323029 [Lactarius deliciosus]